MCLRNEGYNTQGINWVSRIHCWICKSSQMTILKHVTIYSYLAGINNIKSRWRSNLLLLQPVHIKSKCTVQLLGGGEKISSFKAKAMLSLRMHIWHLIKLRVNSSEDPLQEAQNRFPVRHKWNIDCIKLSTRTPLFILYILLKHWRIRMTIFAVHRDTYTPCSVVHKWGITG
jgi:hypothetical protein